MFTEAGKAAAKKCRDDADTKFARALLLMAVVIAAACALVPMVSVAYVPAAVALLVPAAGLMVWSLVITYRVSSGR